jgi:putative ABC transport system permease protein
MRIGRIVRHRLRSLLRGSSVDADMQRELEMHVEQLASEHRAAGMSEAEARRAARRAFGSLEATKELCRDMRRVNYVDDFVKDLKYALAVLRRSPGFTLTAVLSFALGIGANTAIFSVVNAFLLQPLPFAQPERLVMLFERNVIGDEQETAVAAGNFLDWQQQSTSFEQLSAFTTLTVTLSAASADDVPPERVVICACSGNLFTALGVMPALGRSFRADDDRFGAPKTVVISHELWQRQFAGAADVVGKGLRLNDEMYEVIGVMPRGFAYPFRNVGAWRPFLLELPPAQQIRHDLHTFQVIGRVRDGIPLEQATAEIDGISARYKNAHPNEATGKGATGIPLHEFLVRGVRTSLFVLLGAVFCVLLIACVNLANLTLTRSLARTREIGVRAALGASRGRLVRQLITETLLLALIGGAAGAVLATQLTTVLVARAPGADAILLTGRVNVDPAVFLFAFAIALAGALAVGLLPALRVSRVDVANDLKETGRSATAGRAHGRFRAALIAAEVALSIVLLVAAGLLLRSFAQLHRIDPGIRVDRMLTLGTSMVGAAYRQAAQRSAFLSQLSERLHALPGVRSAGLSSCLPLSGACNVLFFYVEGRPYVPGKFSAGLERSVDPHYFATLGIPLVKGRTFTAQDGVGFDPKSPRLGSLVISESMARMFFPNEDPIGKRLFFDFEVQRERNQGLPAPRYEVIGVVGDVVPTLDRPVSPTMYRPLLDVPSGNPTVILHTAGEPRSLTSDVRLAIRELDPTLAIFRVQTMEDQLSVSTADRQFTLLLFATFAAVAVVLAAVGLYGVVSYSVSQRRTEIGIRMALGATRSDVGQLVVTQGLTPAIVGSAIGLAAAFFAARVLRTMLFEVTPTDPITFAVVPAGLLTVAVAACYLPAIRAARQSPLAALRKE